MTDRNDKIVALKKKYPYFYKKYGITERRKRNMVMSRIYRLTSSLMSALILPFFALLLAAGYTYDIYEGKRPLNPEHVPAPELSSLIKMEIDQRVSEVNLQQFRNYEELTEHLIRPYSSENEKFYSIYKWVTSNISYDVDSFRQNHISVEETYPDSVFRRRLAVCSGYSELLSAMATHAGLEVRLVEGQAYDPSGRLNAIVAGDNGHAWNIVKINGYWYQADSTWDAGYVDEDVTRFERKTGKFEYYLADPVKFNVTHRATMQNMNLLNDVEMNQIDLIWHNLLEGKSLLEVVRP